MTGPRLPAPRGHALFAVSTVVFVVAAFAWLDRAGPRAPARLPAGDAPSGAWICPHGGASGLSVALYLANPGATTVQARVTELGTRPGGPSDEHAVPPGATVRIDLRPADRGAASYVEYFGGWIGAGWVSFTDDGVAAEPCASDAARRWYLPDGTTHLREQAYVVVANPFASAAVMDVVLYTSDLAPIRDSAWTDLVLRPRRSMALHLNSRRQGEPVVAVALEVTVGRVAAASLGFSDRTFVRSALGWTEPAPAGTFPSMQGSGQTELLLLSTAQSSIRFGATALSEDQPRPAGGLTEQEHGPAAARAYAIPVEPGPAAIRMFTLDGSTAVGALRALGPGSDLGATGGAAEGSRAWLVLPSVVGVDPTPGVVLVNDGKEDVVATAALLPEEGGTAAAPVTVRVPAHAAAAVPPGFWASAPDAAIVIRTQGGSLVAMAASTSRRPGGAEGFVLSMGVPLPPQR